MRRDLRITKPSAQTQVGREESYRFYYYYCVTLFWHFLRYQKSFVWLFVQTGAPPPLDPSLSPTFPLYIRKTILCVCVFAFPSPEQHMIDNLDREKARVYNTRRE